ncbi:hypothetical protein BDN67DRAFT_966215, partial [Paxillus ammoniavirescens]
MEQRWLCMKRPCVALPMVTSLACLPRFEGPEKKLSRKTAQCSQLPTVPAHRSNVRPYDLMFFRPKKHASISFLYSSPTKSAAPPS